MSKPRILIIEDDPDGRRSVVEALQDGGFAVESAARGGEGALAFRNGAFEAVLTDLVLPDIDGVEVMARIKRQDPEVPVLIMTAYGTVSSAGQAMKQGAYDYVTKPLDLDDLQSKLARALETRRLRGDVRRLADAFHGRYGVEAMVAAFRALQQ